MQFEKILKSHGFFGNPHSCSLETLWWKLDRFKAFVLFMDSLNRKKGKYIHENSTMYLSIFWSKRSWTLHPTMVNRWSNGKVQWNFWLTKFLLAKHRKNIGNWRILLKHSRIFNKPFSLHIVLIRWKYYSIYPPSVIKKLLIHKIFLRKGWSCSSKGQVSDKFSQKNIFRNLAQGQAFVKSTFIHWEWKLFTLQRELRFGDMKKLFNLQSNSHLCPDSLKHHSKISPLVISPLDPMQSTNNVIFSSV